MNVTDFLFFFLKNIINYFPFSIHLRRTQYFTGRTTKMFEYVLRDSSCRLHCRLTKLDLLPYDVNCKTVLYKFVSYFSLYVYYIKFYLVHLKEHRRNSNGIACGQLPRKATNKTKYENTENSYYIDSYDFFIFQPIINKKAAFTIKTYLIFVQIHSHIYTHLVNFITCLPRQMMAEERQNLFLFFSNVQNFNKI